MAKRPTAMKQEQFAEDLFIYEIDFAALAPAAQANGSIQIQADAGFKWIKSTYYATIANAAFVSAAVPIPSVTVNLVDGGSGRQLMSGPVPVPSLFGTGQLPFINTIARVFEPNSTINVSVTNFDAAVTYNLRLSFIGNKVFTYGI